MNVALSLTDNESEADIISAYHTPPSELESPLILWEKK